MNPDVVESWGHQKKIFQNNNFTVVNWEQAKNILLSKKIKGGKQYHTGWLTIYAENGRNYLVKQPEMDTIWEFLDEKNVTLEGFAAE